MIIDTRQRIPYNRKISLRLIFPQMQNCYIQRYESKEIAKQRKYHADFDQSRNFLSLNEDLVFLKGDDIKKDLQPMTTIIPNYMRVD